MGTQQSATVNLDVRAIPSPTRFRAAASFSALAFSSSSAMFADYAIIKAKLFDSVDRC